MLPASKPHFYLLLLHASKLADRDFSSKIFFRWLLLCFFVSFFFFIFFFTKYLGFWKQVEFSAISA